MAFQVKQRALLFILPLLLGGLGLASCGNTNDRASNAPSKQAVKPVETQQAEVKPSAVSQPKLATLPVNGEKVYIRCAACHMKTGEGVKGAFPPLKGELVQLLNSDLGKEYLVLVSIYGLAGDINVAGETYSGMMTAQGGMTPEKTAAVLNHIMQTFNGVSEEDPRLFTARFVTDTKTKYGRLSGRKVYALRDAAYESVLP